MATTEHSHIAVRASLFADESSVFGLSHEEIDALLHRFPDVKIAPSGPVTIKGNLPLHVKTAPV